MSRDPVRGEGMLLAVGVVLLASVGLTAFFALRAIRSAPSAVAAPASAVAPLTEPSREPPQAEPRYFEPQLLEAPPAASSGLKRSGDGGATQRGARLRFGTLTVSGRLPSAVVQRIVRQQFGRFRMCYEQALAGAPALAGRVSVRFVIGRDGRVSNVTNAGSDLPHPTMVSCVLAGFSDLAFPRPESGIVTAVVPVEFAPS